MASSLATVSASVELGRSAIEASANAMVITRAVDQGFIIEYVNPAFERITGFSSGEVLGRNCNFLQGTDRNQPALASIRKALRLGQPGNAVLRNYRKDGTLFWNHLYVAPVTDDSGMTTHFVASQYDITDTKLLEAKLHHLAHHDELTGLPNRALLRDRLAHAIAGAARRGGKIWIVFISLDRFKIINDSFGHAGGDHVLREVATRLSQAVRSTDTVARWGGDEFAILMAEQQADGLGTAAFQRLMSSINDQLHFQGQEIVLTCSMGVAGYPQDGLEVGALIERADMAAFQAKTEGANQFRFHTADMNQRARARLRIEAELRQALERGQFVLHYQPQIDLLSGSIVGAEALVRWDHPERGLLGPNEFIGIAEETGLIVALGDWVLRTACQQNRRWQEQGLPPIRVAVNLSARQFGQASLGARVAGALLEAALEPAYLELELTESLVMRDVERGIGILRELKRLGVTIAVDDFSTGYSTLAYLKRLPIDVLKIDRSFVTDIGGDGGEDAAIVTAIIVLAHTLNLKVLAEGVETADQLAYLCETGCDRMQGYFFSKPVAPTAFEGLLATDARIEGGLPTSRAEARGGQCPTVPPTARGTSALIKQ